MPKRLLILSIVVVSLLAGCGQFIDPNTLDGTSTPQVISVSGTQPIPITSLYGDDSQMIQPIPTPSDPKIQEMIDRASEVLAQNISIPPEQIHLIEAFEVEWADSSLGCPNPSLMYTQVVTPGYLIRLQTPDRVFEIHTDKRDSIIFCDSPSPPVPGALPDR